MTGNVPELLAPAGGPEALRAAVAAGADAVYLGGRSYSARQYAGNFSDEELEEAVGYAHLRNVKVYVTVNTVIRDCELAGVTDYLLYLYSIGVDAVLLQDLGLSSVARAMIPGLRLHASTQMTVHNLAGALYAESLGFERIVLARELLAGDVSCISENLQKAGTEIFTHGALCFSYSGDCLLSAMIGGRSGNRGMCAQPCRKKYRLMDVTNDPYGRILPGKEIRSGYLLSMKDLCMYDQLGQVLSSHVDSLKIEGRMKSPEYVAVVTDIYRRALDAVQEGSFVPSDEDHAMLELAFNREFTPGYFFGCRHDGIISPDRPGNRGLYIGSVVGYDNRTGMMEILLKDTFVPSRGDGLMFLSTGFEKGMVLNKDPVKSGRKIRIKTDMKIPADASVYITRSRLVPDRAKKIIAEGENKRKIPVSMEFTVRDDGAALICGHFQLHDRSTYSLELVSEFRMQEAKTHPLQPEQVKDQLTKAGGTVFEVTGIKIDMPEDLFTPISGLNGFRRRFFEIAETEIINAKRPDPADVDLSRQRISGFRSSPEECERPSCAGGITRLSCYADSIETVEAAIRGGADAIYFEIPEFGVVSLDELLGFIGHADRICDGASVKLYWKLPDIIRQDLLDMVLLMVGRLPPGAGILTGDAGVSAALKAARPDLEIAGSVYLNVCNRLSVRTLSGVFDRLTLSPELSCSDIVDIAGHHGGNAALPLELLVQGNIEVMISENSIAGVPGASCYEYIGRNFGLLDETGRLFPVSVDSSCRTHIRNADELCLFDSLPAICIAGPLSVAIDARGRTPRYAEEMLGLYRKGIEAVQKGAGAKSAGMADLMESVRKISGTRITSGFFRKE